MNNKESCFVSAVVYVHNSESNIRRFLETIISVFESNFSDSEIICVNDCSADKSTEIIKELSKNLKSLSISIINLSYYHGLEMAMNAGVDLSIGDFVFEFDTTKMDYEEQEIMRVYQHAVKGFDIVSAAPSCSQKVTSKLFYRIFDKYTVQKYDMRTERFRILSRRVINRIASMNKSVPYRKVAYANCGLKTDYIQYNPCISVKYNEDKSERRYRSSLAVDSLIIFTDMGYSYAKCMTMIMIAAALITTVYSIVIYTIGNPVAGWTTTLLFLSFSFFGLFGILTIIIKYLQIIVNLIFKRKSYSFDNVEKLTN